MLFDLQSERSVQKGIGSVCAVRTAYRYEHSCVLLAQPPRIDLQSGDIFLGRGGAQTF